MVIRYSKSVCWREKKSLFRRKLLTHIVSTGCARSLGYFSRDHRGVAASGDVLVSRLAVNIVIAGPRHVSSSISGSGAWLFDTSGYVIAPLGPIEQMQPTEIGARAILRL